MKTYIYFLLFSILLFSTPHTFAQVAKYDGDWSAVFQGVGSRKGIDGRPDPGSPVVHGFGKRIYRIKTIDGVTTVRAKVKYVGDDDFQYYQCTVTSCNETSLSWQTQTAHYIAEGVECNIVFCCELTFNSGTLRAYTYHIQNMTENGHTTSKKYGEERFTLYKDSDDW